MVPNSEQRDAIFKKFGRAFFKQDLDLMYEVVTPDFNWTVDDGDKVHVLDSREKIGNFFEQRRGKFENVRFDDVVFHQLFKRLLKGYRVEVFERALDFDYALKNHLPDLIILDIRLRDDNGLLILSSITCSLINVNFV